MLRAGGAYVPIEPSTPGGRMAHVLADAECALLLTQSALKAGLAERLPEGGVELLAAYLARTCAVSRSLCFGEATTRACLCAVRRAAAPLTLSRSLCSRSLMLIEPLVTATEPQSPPDSSRQTKGRTEETCLHPYRCNAYNQSNAYEQKTR